MKQTNYLIYLFSSVLILLFSCSHDNDSVMLDETIEVGEQIGEKDA